MKPYRPKSEFYIVFILLTLVPAILIAQFLQEFLQKNLFAGLSNGIIDGAISLRLIEAPAAITIIGLVFLLYESYLWKLWPFKHVHKVPDINGRYEGFLCSSFNTTVKYPFVFEIEQSLSDLRIIAYTAEESSHSVIAEIGTNNRNHWCVSNIYQDIADPVKAKPDMKNHEGVSFMEIFEDGNMLRGNYYSNPRDRGYYGTYELKRVCRDHHHCFKKEAPEGTEGNVRS